MVWEASSAAGGFEDLEVGVDGGGHADFEGVGDEGVSDGDFEDAGDFEEFGEVMEVEIVAGVDAQAELLGLVGGEGKLAVDFDELVAGGFEGAGVGFGVKLDAIGAGFGDAADHVGVRVHEEADAAAEVFEALDDGFEAVEVGGDVPAMVGGEGVGVVGDEGALVGAGLGDDFEVVAEERVAFDVEFAADVGGFVEQQAQVVDVGGADVAAVGSGMDGDAVGADVEGEAGGFGDAGDLAEAGIAEQGDFVDVDAELGHGG